jgi:hypothetical protein
VLFVKEGSTSIVEGLSQTATLETALKKYKSAGKESKEKWQTWLNYRDITFAGRNLKEFLSFTLESLKISSKSTVYVIPKFIGMTKSYDENTKKVICGITQEPTDDPVMLNPGCLHAFDRVALTKWLKKYKMECPVCKQKLVSMPMKNIQGEPEIE